MRGAGEHVHRHGLFEGVAPPGKPLHVPAQGAGIAGDVDHPLWAHIRDGVHHVLGQPLAGRIHAHHVGAHPLPLQVAGRLPRVGAEEAGVFNVVALGVGDGVVHRLGHHLGPPHHARLPGHDQADGADAAVEIQHRLRPGEAGELQGLAVEHLGLGRVDLIKGGDGQPEGEAAQGVGQEVLPPQGAVGVPQNHVVVLLVHPQHDSGQVGLGPAQGAHQLGLPGDAPAIDQQAAQAAAGPVSAHIHVPHQAGEGALIVGGDGVLRHPLLHGPPQAGGRLPLEQAVVHVDYVMAPGAVEADAGALGHRKLGLVAVAVYLLRPQDGGDVDLRPAQAAQGVLHPDALGLQLLGVVHVPELAAAALGVVQAPGEDAGGGGVDHLLHPAPEGAAAHMGEAHVAGLSPDAALDKDHHPVQPGHPGAVAGVAVDHQAAELPLPWLAVIHLHSRPSWRHRSASQRAGCSWRAGRRPGARTHTPPPCSKSCPPAPRR